MFFEKIKGKKHFFPESGKSGKVAVECKQNNEYSSKYFFDENLEFLTKSTF